MATLLKIEKNDSKVMVLPLDGEFIAEFDNSSFSLDFKHKTCPPEVSAFIQLLNKDKRQFTVTLFSYGLVINQRTYFAMQ